MISAQTDGIQVSVEVFYYPKAPILKIANFYSLTKLPFTTKRPIPCSCCAVIGIFGMPIASKREVEGEGVVGEQPILEPDASYQYMSACNLHTEFGHMNG